MAKKGSGLRMVWCDVPADMEEEFNRWYNEEHLADLLAVPGVLNAARYEAVKGGPKHLACYELENAAVFDSEPCLEVRRNPSEWSRRVSPTVIGTAFIGNSYEMIHPSEVTPSIAGSGMAPALQIGRISIPSEMEDEFNDWYNSIFVPGFERVPGCIRGRRYRVIEGEPKYLTVYEFEHERVSQSAEWERERNSSPLTQRILPHLKLDPGTPGVWKKTFELSKPGVS